MKPLRNPFITSGYESAEYFCDREQESENLIREVTNGNNLALISTRRMGKTGLIQHCFNNPEIKGNYYTFFVDIYATKSLRDLVFSLSRVIVDGLKPFGKKAIESFWNSVKSLQGGITFDPAGNPSFNLQLGDIRSTEATLDEIFRYLEKASRPVIVAIDEFQQVAYYTEKNVEALLRTHIQHCRNARFIFAGSQRHVMGNMFANASRPFYQSVSMMYLECIGLSEYENFARRHFENSGRKIEQGVVADIYDRFDGVTWYVQKMLNMLYGITPERGECRAIFSTLTNTPIRRYCSACPKDRKSCLSPSARKALPVPLPPGSSFRNTVCLLRVRCRRRSKDCSKRISLRTSRAFTAFTTSFSGYGSIRITD